MSTTNIDNAENKGVHAADSISKLTWVIDPERSKILFKIKHLMIAHVTGSFNLFDATVTTIGKDVTTANVDLWIDVESIDTNNDIRDNYLKSSDFFGSTATNKIIYKSTSIVKSDSENNHLIEGDLTIKNILKKVFLTIEFSDIIVDSSGEERVRFAVKGKIKRSEWGITWNSLITAEGLMVSDDITISCAIELTLKK
jgi:polyisoprenoid-binding protein YceI